MARRLEVEIVGDASSYQRTLASAGHSTDSFGRGIASMAKVAAVGFVALGAGAVVGINKAISAASDMGETVSKVNTVFGESGKAVEAWGESLATSFGLSKQQALDAAAIFGTFGKAAGLTGQALTEFSKPLVEAAGDLASFHNVPVAQALEDIRSGLSGETEPLRKYGILLNDAALRQEALKLGLVKTTKDALAPQNKMLAAQRLILEKLGPATGDFARTSDSAANRQRILAAEVSNLSAQLGGKLLPAKVAVLGFLTDIVGALDRIGQAKGFTAKVHVAFDIAKDAFNEIRQKVNDALFGSFSKGGAGGVGPEGIHFNQGIVQKVADGFKALDWTEVGKSVIDGLVKAMKATGELAKSIADTAMSAIRKINWEGVGRVLGPGLATAVLVAFQTLMDPSFWARNWDLALSVALVAFSGPIGRVAGKLVGPLAKLGGDLVLGIAGGIERFAPKLADLFLTAIEGLGKLASAGAQRVAQLFSAGLGTLEGLVRGLFGKLGGLAVFAIKVLGIDAAINAIGQFAVKVGGWFADLGRKIAGFFEDAWGQIKRGAIVAALAVVEPFSHLPSKLGGWARSAKDSMQAELDKIDAAAITQKLVDQMGDKAGAMRAAGAALAGALAKGITDGLASQLTTVGQSIGGFIASVGAYARKNTGSTTEQYFAKMIGVPAAKGIATGAASQVAVVGASLAKLLQTSIGKAAAATKDAADVIGKSVSSSVIKGLGNAGAAIIAAAKKVGVDARAALAVAMSEGGTSFGAVGDKGTSFGPFQLHIGGALGNMDAAKGAAFANSLKGITFALEQMAKAGAAGKTGYDAISAIVRNFERPADPSGEVRRAIDYYKQLPAEIGNAAVEVASKTSTSTAAFWENVVKVTKEAIAAAKQAVTDATGGFKTAFGDLATAALAAFDEKMAKWKPPSGTLLAAFQLQDQINQATSGLGPAVNEMEQRLAAAFTSGNKDAIDAAQADLDKALTDSFNAVNANTANLVDAQAALLQQAQAEGDPEKIATAQAAYDQALAERKTALEQNYTDQRALIEMNLQYRADAEQRTHDAIATKQREGLAKQLYELQQWLLKHPEEWDKMGAKVLKILGAYHIKLGNVGTHWADKLAGGITAGIPAVVKAAKALADAVDDAMGLGVGGSGSGSGGGGQVVRITGQGKHLAKGGIVTRPLFSMIGEAGPEAVIPLSRAGDLGGTVNVYVAGTVVSETQLVDAVYRGLVRKSGRNAGNLGLA